MTSIGKLRIGEKVPARIMGVINVSPESFYKNSVKTKVNEIANVATEMQETGADMIDVGAMSTAPYLETIISVGQETKRMSHAIEVIKSNCSLPISADTPRLSRIFIIIADVLMYSRTPCKDRTEGESSINIR